MSIKRLLGEGFQEDFEHPTGEDKRQCLLPNILEGATSERTLRQLVLTLEPVIRTWVHEEVDNSFKKLRAHWNQTEQSGCRTWQLRFQNKIAQTIFTGSKVVSEDKSPVKVILYDSSAQEIVSGPLFSVKVGIVVLDSEFNMEDHNDWVEQDFDRKTVQNREGKRPLVTGNRIVQLHEGVGYISDISFTDNSSWIRSGKFRLGAKALTAPDQIRIREGISNAFKVKDHRGESYQKYYPPSLSDEVWRLEKIAKDGTSHKKLAECGVHTVGDFLRWHSRNQFSLRALLNSSNKLWETIIGHASTCTLDDKLYLYRSAEGTGLLFNSIDKVIGATFDGRNYHSLDKLDMYQMKMVANLKQDAYENTKNWVLVNDPSIVGYPIQSQFASGVENSFNNQNLDHMHFKGESSNQMQGFNPELRNNSTMDDSPERFLAGNLAWTYEDNFIESHLLTDDDFQVVSSSWQGSVLFHASNHHN